MAIRFIAKAGAGISTVLVLLFCPHSSVIAQTPKGAVSHVPFVGCKSDGQVGPLVAPKGKSPSLQIAPNDAAKLAYYQAEEGFGVLGPRGWHCFSTYGSNGANLFVTPDPISGEKLFSDGWKGFSGPAIQVSTMIGDTSGRFEVARTIARVFPAHRNFAEDVISEKIRPAGDFPFGAYPPDKLVYRSKETVEYVTPANSEGLGTQSKLLKNGDSISGVAILFGEEPNLVQLSVRLPADLKSLAPIILREVEREAKALESK